MFTGLIQTVGVGQMLDLERIQISSLGTDTAARSILQDLAIGDSVAVDGICLTVVEIMGDGFVADISPETLQRSTFSQLHRGLKTVNLETSLRVGSKVGGHFVTGHVDGLGVLKSARSSASSWELTFEISDPAVGNYILSKGSIAVNGISLTIADCHPLGQWFTTAVIPHTYTYTNLHNLQAGDWVNLEGDILGKYVEKLLGRSSRNTSIQAPWDIVTQAHEPVTADFLAEHGY